MSTQQWARTEPPGVAQPSGLPRLLARVPSHGAMSLPEHEALHGSAPLPRKRRRGDTQLVEQLEHSGLRGRGGAGFPTATKMRAVICSRGRPIVVVNAAEGEPASLKDKTLTRTLPHLVLDGAELAAAAIGAGEAIVCACESARSSVESLAMAIAERGADGGPARLRLVTVPDRYLASQESALLAHLNGSPALPAFTPPMPFERGVGRRPTFLSNAETFAHIALIARHGAGWFRELGTSAQPGSTLVTLQGPVVHPGVFEIELGASVASLVEAAGGTTARPRAVLLGGYGGTWVDAAHMRELLLADEHLAPYDASVGAGVVLILSEHACPAAEVARLAGWMADQSARQCGPCVHGLDAIAESLQRVADGTAEGEESQRLARLGALVEGRGACRHPDGGVRMTMSALDTFAVELDDHARHGACERCSAPPELPLR